jgi:hypothetical protein
MTIHWFYGVKIAQCLNLNRKSCNMGIKIVYWSSQPPDKELYRGDVNPGLGARDRSLEILCQAAVSIEPREGSFCASAWNKDPVFGVIGIQSGPRDGGSTVASVGDKGARLGMLVVETIAKIRRAYFAQNKPIKTICRELGVSRRVVRKAIRS